MARDFESTANEWLNGNTKTELLWQNTLVFTWSGWIKFEAYNADTLYTIMQSNHGTGANKGWGAWYDNRSSQGSPRLLRIITGDGGGPPTLNSVSANGVISDNNWHHVAFRSDGATAKVFVDGADVSAGTPTFGPPSAGNHTYNLELGTLNGGASLEFDGSMAEVAGWDADIGQGNIALLAKGVSPVAVRPLPDFYRSFIRDINGLHSLGLSGLAVGSGTTVTPHPPILYPGRGAQRLWGLKPAAGGPTPIGLTTETDVAFGLSVLKSRAVGLPSETDSAFALTVGKALAVGQPVETDAALAVATAKARTIGLATETDLALSATALRAYGLGLVTSAEVSLTLAALKSLGLGLTTEVDAALAMTWSRALSIGLVTETDSALAMTAAGALSIGLATETDAPFAMTWRKAKALGLATETDLALAITAAGGTPVGLTTETDAANAFAHSRALAAGLTTETDAATAMSARKDIALGLTTESDIALAAAIAKARTLGLAVETHVASAMTWARALSLGLVTETDTAFVVLAVGPTVVVVLSTRIRAQLNDARRIEMSWDEAALIRVNMNDAMKTDV